MIDFVWDGKGRWHEWTDVLFCCGARLDFNVGKIHVKDQFVWDVGDPSATPEEFAKVTCKDLKLPSRCIPEIAYQIREQVMQLKKAGRKGGVSFMILSEFKPSFEHTGVCWNLASTPEAFPLLHFE